MNIEARFNIQRENFTLDAQLTTPMQGLTAVFGPSGCGKTTLLRAIAGLEYCSGGYLAIGDQRWQDRQQFVPIHKRSLGYVFQEATLFPHLTVCDNLEYGFKRLPVNERRLGFEQVTELLGVKTLLSRHPAHLSGGERQRVAIARAVLTSPSLLLMDEPLAALDVKSKTEIYPFIDRLHQELDIPVIYVSHSPDEVARLADHLALMESGKIVASGPITDMFTRTDLPLAHSNDAESIIEAKVTDHDEEFQLSYLTFAGGKFTVPGTSLKLGQKVRLRILARDVSLTLEHQTNTSILNIFAVVVDSIIEHSPSQVTVRLSAQGTPILARLTRKSASQLGLETGKPVYAQVKSVATLA